jgi:hypothetical protein
MVKEKEVPFHFLLLGIGYIIKIYGYANPAKLQSFINEDPAFGIRISLSQCRLAFELLEDAGFIVKSSGGNWEKGYM